MRLLDVLRRFSPGGHDPEPAPGEAPAPLPDPALPPARRGTWEQAALTNVDITEVVKERIRTQTRPWQK